MTTTLFDIPPVSAFAVGAKVRHAFFGNGTVIKADRADGLIVVKFACGNVALEQAELRAGHRSKTK